MDKTGLLLITGLANNRVSTNREPHSERKNDMKLNVTRAWKDEMYCESLNAEQLAALPAHPAGVEMTEVELEAAFGGSGYRESMSSMAVGLCDLILFTITGGIFGNVLTLGPTQNCAG
jgi:mersacidin/lichenicidin family type 2 lantibiotic